jgi:hypothetical protein
MCVVQIRKHLFESIVSGLLFLWQHTRARLGSSPHAAIVVRRGWRGYRPRLYRHLGSCRCCCWFSHTRRSSSRTRRRNRSRVFRGTGCFLQRGVLAHPCSAISRCRHRHWRRRSRFICGFCCGSRLDKFCYCLLGWRQRQNHRRLRNDRCSRRTRWRR